VHLSLELADVLQPPQFHLAFVVSHVCLSFRSALADSPDFQYSLEGRTCTIAAAGSRKGRAALMKAWIVDSKRGDFGKPKGFVWLAEMNALATGSNSSLRKPHSGSMVEDRLSRKPCSLLVRGN